MKKRWSTGLYQCCADPKVCCEACACPCVTFGKIAAALPPGSAPLAGDESAACFAYWGLTAASGENDGIGAAATVAESYLVAGTRAALRRLYGIPTEPGCCQSDCFIAVCCARCALCQEMREINIRSRSRFGRAPEETIFCAPPVVRL
jgi:Cys-rich protein (TIGR01571 family)